MVNSLLFGCSLCKFALTCTFLLSTSYSLVSFLPMDTWIHRPVCAALTTYDLLCCKQTDSSWNKSIQRENKRKYPSWPMQLPEASQDCKGLFGQVELVFVVRNFSDGDYDRQSSILLELVSLLSEFLAFQTGSDCVVFFNACDAALVRSLRSLSLSRQLIALRINYRKLLSRSLTLFKSSYRQCESVFVDTDWSNGATWFSYQVSDIFQVKVC